MLTKTEAIVLHAFKLGDTRMIVHLFTREHGRVPFVVSLPKTQRGRLKKQFFQPLTLINIEADIRPRLELQKLSDAAIAAPYTSMHTEPAKLAIALFTAEFLYQALKGEQQNVPLYAYVRSAVLWLDGAPDHFANFHLVFLMRLSRFLGFYPNLDDYRSGCYFDLRAATFCTVPPLHRDFLQPDETATILQLMRMDFTTMHLFHLNRQQRNRILEVCLAYYQLHLPDFAEMRSLAVLRELW